MKKLYLKPQTDLLSSFDAAADLMQLVLGSLSMQEPGKTPLRQFQGDSFSSLKYLI